MKNFHSAKPIYIIFFILLFFSCRKYDVSENLQSSSAIKFFGGRGMDQSVQLIITADGDIAIAGSSSSFGNGDRDMYVIKTNSKGVMKWQKHFGTPYSEDAFSLASDASGNIFVAGNFFHTDSNGAQLRILPDAYAIKTDASGNILKETKIKAPVFAVGKASCIIPLADGNFFVSGNANNKEGFISKINSDGDTIFIHPVHGFAPNLKDAEWMSEMNNMIYAISGVAKDTLGLLSFSSNGKFDKYIFIPITGTETTAKRIKKSSDGNLLISLTKNISAEVSSLMLMKISSDGKVIWKNEFSSGGKGVARSFCTAKNGNIYLIGSYVEVGSATTQMYIASVSNDGVLQWEKKYGGNIYSEGTDIAETSDGNLVFCGNNSRINATSQDLILGFIDLNGNLINK